MNCWTTIDGIKIPFEKVTHQHWSNIYWYHTLLCGYTGKFATRVAEKNIQKDFNGEILPYEPQYGFEIKELDKLGLLRGNYVIVEDKVIGKINPDNIKSFILPFPHNLN